MKLGGSEVIALRLGSTEVVAAYLGSTLVWTAGVRLTGALLATTALSGGFDVARPLAGALSAVATLAGAMGTARPLSGSMDASSALVGDLTVSEDVLLSGALSALSSTSGGLSVARAIAGSVASLSAVSGAVAVDRVLSGAAAAISSMAGTATARRALAGAMGSISSASAALTVTASSITFTFVGSCVSNSSSLNFASLSAGSIAAGDLAVYIDYATAASVSSVTPSGFTTVSSAATGDNSVKGFISVKKLTGSEGAVTGMNGTSTNNKIGLVFRPSQPFTTITASGASQVVTTLNPTAQVCDPSAETSAVILIAAAAHEFATAAFSTFSPAADGTVLVANSDLIAGYKAYNTSPQSTTVDMNDLGNQNWLASLYLTVS